MDKRYIEDQYHQAMLEFKTAINEDTQWEARKTMARLEALAIEMFGEGFQKELREKEHIDPEAAKEAEKKHVPRRYRQGADGQMHRSWNGKLPEEFSEKDALAFLVDTDLQLNGTISQDTLTALDQAGYIYKDGLVQAKESQPEQPSETARFIEEYAGKIEKLVEDNKNFPVGDSSIFPFEIPNGSHAAVRYAYVSKSNVFEDIRDAESGVKLNVTAAIYRDGTLNEYDQGIEERKFVLRGTDAINGFMEKLSQSIADSIKNHPDAQPVVTVNFSEYDKFNPLVKDHMRLTLDRANSLFELINIVVSEAGEKGHQTSYRTDADIMYVQDGKIRHFDLRQEFGKSGSIIKSMEGYIDEQLKYWRKHRTQPDGESRLEQWETAQKELVPYFERHISLSSAERNLEYLGEAASTMQNKIFEMRAFLNTGRIVPVPGRNQPEQEDDFSRQIDDVLEGKADRYNDVKVCATPDLLVQAGCSQLPMFITQSHIRDIIHPKGKNPHWHGLTVQQLKKVPEMISDPVMIFDSANRKDSVVVALGETDNEKLPIIISVRPQGKGKYELAEVESNFITSIYGKDNFLNFIGTVIKEDRMIYCNKQKSQELFSVLGLQLPQGFNNLDFNKIIHVSRNIVKEGIIPETAHGGIVTEPIPAVKTAPAEPQEEETAGDGRAYLSLPHVSKEKFPALLQELKQNGAKFDVGRKQWYVDREAAGSGLFNAYLWTYLSLPRVNKEKFQELLQELKQGGARFDQNKKKWYIDGNCDREKFLQYLEPDPQGRFPAPLGQTGLSAGEAAQIKEITDRLEQGIQDLFDSDRFKEYLRVMSRFHDYSLNNTLLIAMQKPDASLVAGYSDWKNNFERNVMKGQKGIKIIAPSPFKIKQEVEMIDPLTQKPIIGKDGKPVTEEKEVRIPAYKVVSVFDVSQTEGKALPTIGVSELTGDVEQYADFFKAVTQASPVPVDFEKIGSGAKGYYSLTEKRIVINEGMGELQNLKTLIHEIAHARLHDVDPGVPAKEQADRPDRRTREVQAESIAYAVCQHYGLDTSDYSFSYVASWSSGRELSELKASLETIHGTVSKLIKEIDKNIGELTQNKEQAQEMPERHIGEETVQEAVAAGKTVEEYAVPGVVRVAPASGERASVLSRLEKAKEAATGHGMDDQIRDAQHRQEEKVRETGHGRE